MQPDKQDDLRQYKILGLNLLQLMGLLALIGIALTLLVRYFF